MAMTNCRECDHPISKKAQACPSCGATKKKKTSLFTWLVLLLFVIWVAGYMPDGVTDKKGVASPNGHVDYTPKSEIMKNVELDFSWGTKGFGNIMNANFTITNNSNIAIKDVDIECSHFAKSGTLIDSNKRTIYEIVDAGETKQFNDFDMGFIHSQANESSCVISDLEPGE